MAGRKPAKIDWARVDEMLAAQCHGTEIAAALGIHPDTLYNACIRDNKTDFSAYSQAKKAAGVQFARESFYRQAWHGDPEAGTTATRQIFWLKNHASMADKQEVKQEINATVQKVIFELPDNTTGPGDPSPVPPDWEAITGGGQPG
jgi:hypothetical protein